MTDFIVHGSRDSGDIDIFVLLDNPLTDKECKDKVIELGFSEEFDVNFICVTNGYVSWVWHGTVDEANNSLKRTYSLHDQIISNPIIGDLPREVSLKIMRCVRSILSHLSRTQYRADVKAALKSSDFKEKIRVLRKINLEVVDDFGKGRTDTDVYKTLAFQLGQTIPLIEYGKELYTKSEIAAEMPFLRPVLYRHHVGFDVRLLQSALDKFCNLVDDACTMNEDGSMVLITPHSKELADPATETFVKFI